MFRWNITAAGKPLHVGLDLESETWNLPHTASLVSINLTGQGPPTTNSENKTITYNTRQYVPSGKKNDEAKMLYRKPQKSLAGAKHILSHWPILKLRPVIPPPDVHGKKSWPTGQEARGNWLNERGSWIYFWNEKWRCYRKKRNGGRGRIAFEEVWEMLHSRMHCKRFLLHD